MRRLFRWLIRSAIFLVGLFIIVLLAKDPLLKEYIQWQIRKETGCDVSIGRFELSLFKPTLLVEDLKLYNPPEFGGGTFIAIPELRMEYDPIALKRDELHITSGVLNISEFNIIHNAKHQTNVEYLQEHTKLDPEKPMEINFTGIDTLTLTLGTFRESQVNGGLIAQQNLGITNRVLRNVRSETDLSPLLLDVFLKYMFNGPQPRAARP